MSTWEKAFDTFQWENRSQSTNTPLDATHLNKVNDALDVIDDRVIELQSADADMEEEIAGKQDALTFDDVPTDGSNNPVKSNGIYDALDGKVDKNGTDRLMTADEGTKLEGIAAGAQVNVLEGVVVDSIVQPISGKKAFIDLSGKTDLSVIAYTFNSEMGYFKGAYVTYNGKLYEFIQEHTGAWNPSHVREIRASGQYVRTGNGGYNNGDRATCEGYMTKASGNYSHAEGRETQAIGECTHAEGRETIANGIYQHVEGKYNIADNESKYIHIIGNGIDDNNRSNAMTLDWDGNLEVSGDVEDGNGEKISDKADKVTNATSGHLAGLDANGNLTDSGVSPTEDVTVEGNPVTFDSPFEQDAKSVVVTVKPIQDLHGLPFPYVGGAYKNKAKPAYTGNTVGMTVTEIKDNGDNILGYKFTGTSLNTSGTVLYDFPVSASDTDYKIIRSDVPQNVNSFVWDSTASTSIAIVGNTVTAPANHSVHLAVIIPTGTELTNATMQFMLLETTETDSTFAPYSNICPISGIDEVEIEVSDGESEPTTTTIPLPSTLYDADVDVTNGDADDNGGFVVFDGSSDENWGKESSDWNVNHLNVFYIQLPAAGKNVGDSAIPNLISNEIEVISFNGIQSADKYGYITQSGYGQYIEVALDFDTVADLKTWLANNPLQVQYELATPTTLSFDPMDVKLLEGTNVVSTNGEKVAVTYGRSLWQDIDDLKNDTEGKLNKSDVATIEGDTASKAYSVNDFMLRSDGFYRVTAPIAQNASITTSNTTKTTVGEVLTALLNA